MGIIQIQAGKTGTALTPFRLVRGDNLTQIVRATVNRYFGGVDLGGLEWQVSVQNSAGEREMQPVESAAGDKAVNITWNVRGAAASRAGLTRFQFIGRQPEDGGAVWLSGVYGITVDEALTDSPAYADVELTVDVFGNATLSGIPLDVDAGGNATVE